MSEAALMEQSIGADGGRSLLRLLRNVMAGADGAQERLDKVVQLIAASMEGDVCSAYLMRAGDILELYATQGLFPEAVHRTRLRLGEGLVGVIAATARPLSLAEAQEHPAFAYRPETGEEIFHSLMGVPILRAGRVTGVLVVQNRSPRVYTDEEIEALQTVAMVLAELVAAGDLVTREELHPTEGIALLPHRLEGIKLNAGLALGKAVLHEHGITIRQVVAEDPEAELTRLHRSIRDMQQSLDKLFSASDLGSGDHDDILQTYKMFAEDRGWLGRIREAVQSGLTAEAAVQKVRDDTRARMTQISDPYIRERLTDLEDLANRLQHHLSGEAPTSATETAQEDFVIVARDMGPAELLDYDRSFLRGVILEDGSPNAHVVVVARALDIPVIGRCRGALAQIDAGDLLALDGDNGQVLIRPGEDVQQSVENRLTARKNRLARYQELRELPSQSLDGVSVKLSINAGLVLDLPELEATNADGIGLYRTELPFMVRREFPTVMEQTQIYRRVLDQAGSKPVMFRTLDIGGDKLLSYLPGTEEENPAMGWRAIRIALDRPSMLRHQLRALIRAADGRPLSVMFPMVVEIAEFRAARAILDLELSRGLKRGWPLPSKLAVGTMIETPSLIFQLEALCREVDFLSVGSNDLMQFLFARDRGNPRLADRYDVLSPPALTCLREIFRIAKAAKVPVSVCGEMAANPLEAMALIGLGFRSLSMTPSAVGPVRSMVRSLNVGRLRDYIDELCSRQNHSLRSLLQAFAQDHGIQI